MQETERYQIYCFECADNVTLIPDTDSSSFRCPACDNIYYNEDGVYDLLEAEEYYLSYKGAKLAGLIKEEDVPREPWNSRESWN